MRLKLFALVSLIAVVSGAFFLLRPVVLPGEPEPEPCTGPNCGPAGLSAEEQLAERYAPVIYLADSVTDCSLTDGDFRPVPVETVLGKVEVTLRDSSGQVAAKPAATAADLYNLGPEFHLDLPGSPRRPGCRYVRDGQAMSEGQPNVAYARFTTEEGQSELVLQYWLFYYFNQWNNKHEGDWEMIQLVFEASSAQDALDQDPLRIAYSQHSGGELALWDDDKLEREGSRPILHIAAGSHSNRFSSHVFIGRAEQGAGFGCDDATGQTRLSLEARLIPETLSGPEDPYAWTTFKGRWGERAGPEFNGPTGPNMKIQWATPLTWEENLTTSSVRLPSGDTLGPSAIESFCDVVAWGSNLLLPIYLQLPEISLIAAVLLSVGMVASLTRTRYIPVLRVPLRTRRRAGQILTSAATVYTTHLRLFIGIGLIFLPVAVTVSILHWVVFSISPIDPIVPVPRANIAQDLILAFALSELQFGITYGVVLSACSAAISALDRNKETGVRLSYREVWRRLPHVLLPRLAAIGVVAGLVLTVVGIPLAVRQAVRWSFIEQTVLLDGVSGRDALNASSDVVDRDWWWAAACVIALGAMGLFLAPAVGIVLILFAPSIPLSDVNLITSVLHVALVPFVAIATALVYFDLKSRE